LIPPTLSCPSVGRCQIFVSSLVLFTSNFLFPRIPQKLPTLSYGIVSPNPRLLSPDFPSSPAPICQYNRRCGRIGFYFPLFAFSPLFGRLCLTSITFFTRASVQPPKLFVATITFPCSFLLLCLPVLLAFSHYQTAPFLPSLFSTLSSFSLPLCFFYCL